MSDDFWETYTRMYANNRWFHLYRGYAEKTWRSDGRKHRMPFWEIGLGRLVFKIGRWSK